MRILAFITNGFMASCFLLLVLASCASNLEAQKAQALAARELGEGYLARGDHSSALRELLKSERLYADDPELQNGLGLAYMGKDRLEKAVSHFQRALAIDADYGEAINNLGVAYLKMGDWSSAIRMFHRLTEDLLYPTPHYPLSNLGLAYYHNRNFRLSEKYYRKALEEKGNFLNALVGLGKTHAAMGEGKEAAEAFEKAAALAPEIGRIHFELAEAYESCGNPRKAMRSYRKVIDLDPEGSLAESARSALSRLP